MVPDFFRHNLAAVPPCENHEDIFKHKLLISKNNDITLKMFNEYRSVQLMVKFVVHIYKGTQ